MGVLYNKAIFEECGLKAPDTLSDLESICETLKAKGYTPFMLAFQEQWVPQLMTGLTLGDIVSGADVQGQRFLRRSSRDL